MSDAMSDALTFSLSKRESLTESVSPRGDRDSLAWLSGE